MATAAEGPTVGRAAELAAVATFLGAIASGPVGLVVEGEAGIGKTAVWRAAVAAAAARGCRVVSATAVEHEADLPFVVLRDLVDPVASTAAAGLPATQRHALDVALMRVADPARTADAHAVSVAVLGVVRTVAAERPLVVAVDDVGWIDRSSERVLRYVVRRLTDEPVGILLARRPGGDGLPLGLDTVERLQRIELGPLTADELFDVLVARAGVELSRRDVNAVHRESGGNPFHAVQMAKAVAAGGASPTLPGGVRALTATRLAALRPAARQVVAVVATLATPTVALVRAAAGPATEEGLAEAVDEDLLRITGEAVGFTHPLLRSAAAAAIPTRERQRLHRLLADLVRDPDERAAHLAAATHAPDEAVAASLDAAARRAFMRGAPDVAADLAARAVALTRPGSDRRPGRQVRTAEYRYRSEDPAAADGLVDVIAQLPPGELRAEAKLWLTTLLQVENRWPEALPLAVGAAEEAAGAELRSATERTLAFALVVSGDPATADVHARRALELAEATGDPSALAESRTAVAWTGFWNGRGLRTDLLDAAAGRTAWTRYAPHGAPPPVFAGLMRAWADDALGARRTLAAEHRRLAELGHDRPLALVLFALGELACRTGDIEQALAHADAGHRTAALAGAEFYRSLLVYVRGLGAAHRGHLADARALAEEALGLATAGGSGLAVMFARSLLGFVALAEGDHRAAHEQLGPLTERLPVGAFDPGLARFVPDDVEALVGLGEHAAAAERLAPYEAQAHALDRAGAIAAAGRCRALLLAATGAAESALPVLDAALAAHDRVTLPFERARTLLVAGAVRRRARRRGAAAAALDAAVAEFTQLGAERWAERAREERARVSGRSGEPHRLTSTERRIAEEVAAGRTNREVAAALFLTVSTVEAALWKIYRKLDVRSRTELAARLRADR